MQSDKPPDPAQRDSRKGRSANERVATQVNSEGPSYRSSEMDHTPTLVTALQTLAMLRLEDDAETKLYGELALVDIMRLVSSLGHR